MSEPARIRRVLGWAYIVGGPVMALVVFVGTAARVGT